MEILDGQSLDLDLYLYNLQTHTENRDLDLDLEIFRLTPPILAKQVAYFTSAVSLQHLALWKQYSTVYNSNSFRQ